MFLKIRTKTKRVSMLGELPTPELTIMNQLYNIDKNVINVITYSILQM